MSKGIKKFVQDCTLFPFNYALQGGQNHSITQSEHYRERSLAIKEKAVNALSQLHGDIRVTGEQFLRKQEESQKLLRDLGYEVGEVQKELSATTDAVELGNLIAMRGYKQAHEDLVELTGSVQNVEKAVIDHTRKIHGPDYPQSDITSIVTDHQNFNETLSAYSKGFLTQESTYEFENLINDRIGSRELGSKIKRKLQEKLAEKKRLLKSGEFEAENDAIEEAIFLIEYPSLLISDPGDGYEKLERLSHYASRYNIPGLDDFIKKARGLSVSYKKAMNTPVTKSAMVEYANSGLLTDYMQHVVKAKFREARLSGTLVDLTYNHLELLEQGDVANQYLDSITNELVKSNENLVDLNNLVGDFIDVVEAGFESVVANLNRVSNEIALTRAALITELRHIEQTMVNIGNAQLREQKYANILHERLVWLYENSHENEAAQYFKDGFNCLMRAETRSQLEDAYAAFIDGTKKVRSSVENQYGAGYAAELLGNLKEAAERYDKAASYSVGELPETASISYEGLARVAQKQKKLRFAYECSEKAVEANQENLSALYDQARYLALMGNSQEAIQKLAALIPQDEKYFILMSLAPEFQQLEIKILYDKLWDERSVKNPICLRQLLNNFLLLDDHERAFAVFLYLFDFHPKTLLTPTAWIPQLFKKIDCRVKEYLEQLLSKGITSGNQRYTRSLIFLKAGFPSENLLKAFLDELTDDPAYYGKDVKKIHQNLADNPQKEVKKLIGKIQPILPGDYGWLQLENFLNDC